MVLREGVFSLHTEAGRQWVSKESCAAGRERTGGSEERARPVMGGLGPARAGSWPLLAPGVEGGTVNGEGTSPRPVLSNRSHTKQNFPLLLSFPFPF